MFARRYAHAGMVRLGGEKMSKSLGNLVFVSELLAAGVDPMAIRLVILAHHYRSDWDWTDEGLAAAQARLARWRAAVAAVSAAPAGPGPDARAGCDDPGPSASGAPDGPGPRPEVLAAVRARLADDLDAPGALAVVDAWADAVLAGCGLPLPGPGGRARPRHRRRAARRRPVGAYAAAKTSHPGPAGPASAGSIWVSRGSQKVVEKS